MYFVTFFVRTFYAQEIIVASRPLQDMYTHICSSEAFDRVSCMSLNLEKKTWGKPTGIRENMETAVNLFVQILANAHDIADTFERC